MFATGVRVPHARHLKQQEALRNTLQMSSIKRGLAGIYLKAATNLTSYKVLAHVPCCAFMAAIMSLNSWSRHRFQRAGIVLVAVIIQ